MFTAQVTMRDGGGRDGGVGFSDERRPAGLRCLEARELAAAAWRAPGDLGLPAAG